MSAGLLDEIRLDMAAVVAAAGAASAAAERVRTAAAAGERSWAAMPSAFAMHGVSEAMPAMTRRSSDAADGLADSVTALHRLLDGASFEFADLRSRRAVLAERIASFTDGIGHAVAQHDAALADPTATTTPWREVPGLAAEDTALRSAVHAWNEQWREWQRDLASRVRRIDGGDSTDGLATDATDVRTASLVAPMPLPGFPSTPFQFPWPWLGAAGGTAAGAGSAAAGAFALELLGILFGLSGDTAKQTPADAMRQRMAQADADAWSWVHDPITGRPREVAGGAGIMTDAVGPMTGPEAIQHARQYGRVPKKKPVGEVGTPEQLVDIWKELTRGGRPMEGGAPESVSVELPDGSRVQWRPDSQSGGPTIEINAGGISKYKIHLPKGSPRHELSEEHR
ncbi:hypothetical protein L2091_02675 [Curtobacterium albidum]|uniref:hypothetical protein n=1 Tax=Curtobacterium citreum TaxID=2036 RepID=UPI0020269713|nr:hypothetical protein [Curtobacterium albidum]MCL9664130.1 hypothetical protein [Curtobacterium albidum]